MIALGAGLFLLALGFSINSRSQAESEAWIRRSITPFLERIDPILAKGVAPISVELRRAGITSVVGQEDFYRFQRWMLFAGIALGLFLSLICGLTILATFLLMCAGALLAFVAHRSFLKVRERRFQNELRSAFPDFAERLAISAVAGEGIFPALARMTESFDAESPAFDRSLLEVVRRVHGGESMMDALSYWVQWYRVPGGERLVDALSLAHLNGTPVGPLLLNQAHEVREETRRALLEACGKSEIAMAIPVVFLILPVTVLFALFPSLSQLNLLSFN